MKPRAILFDLDDTLIDHSGSLEKCWQVAANRAAEIFAGLDVDRFLEVKDRAAQDYWSANHREGRLDLRMGRRRVVALTLEELGLDSGRAAEIADLLHVCREGSYELIPDAIETLERLRAEGIKLALVTNGESLLQRSKLERFELARHFDHIQIEGEFGLGKPEEEAYRAALQALDVGADEAWMIGDNLEWEVAAPQRVGIYSIWVDPSGTGVPPDSDVEPDMIVRSVGELVGILSLAPSPQ
jgi:putative hydrolase of the HAD superfamily